MLGAERDDGVLVAAIEQRVGSAFDVCHAEVGDACLYRERRAEQLLEVSTPTSRCVSDMSLKRSVPFNGTFCPLVAPGKWQSVRVTMSGRTGSLT